MARLAPGLEDRRHILRECDRTLLRKGGMGKNEGCPESERARSQPQRRSRHQRLLSKRPNVARELDARDPRVAGRCAGAVPLDSVKIGGIRSRYALLSAEISAGPQDFPQARCESIARDARLTMKVGERCE